MNAIPEELSFHRVCLSLCERSSKTASPYRPLPWHSSPCTLPPESPQGTPPPTTLLRSPRSCASAWRPGGGPSYAWAPLPAPWAHTWAQLRRRSTEASEPARHPAQLESIHRPRRYRLISGPPGSLAGAPRLSSPGFPPTCLSQRAHKTHDRIPQSRVHATPGVRPDARVVTASDHPHASHNETTSSKVSLCTTSGW